MDMFEVTLKAGLGGPYFVDAVDADEAAKKALSRYRYHQTAMDNMPIEKVVAEVKQCSKSAVQYA